MPEDAAAEDRAVRLKRETEVRQKLAAELQPGIEEALRAKLLPQLEQELRPKLIAALRPGIEAEIRTALTKELAPRVELELKARFARTMAAQKAAVLPAAPAEAATLVPAAAPAAAVEPGARVLASLSAPLFGVDKNGICNYLSPAWAQFSGFAVSDTLGKPLADCFADADRRVVTALLTGIGGGSALRFDQQAALRRNAGTPLWVDISAAPLTAADGTLIGACGVIRDAAELRRALEQSEADGVRLLLLVDQIDTAVILEDAGGNIQQANAALCALLSLDAAPYSLEGMPVAELLESAASRFIGPQGCQRRVICDGRRPCGRTGLSGGDRGRRGGGACVVVSRNAACPGTRGAMMAATLGILQGFFT
jgi:PAS domain S-box-containing protein